MACKPFFQDEILMANPQDQSRKARWTWKDSGEPVCHALLRYKISSWMRPPWMRPPWMRHVWLRPSNVPRTAPGFAVPTVDTMTKGVPWYLLSTVRSSQYFVLRSSLVLGKSLQRYCIVVYVSEERAYGNVHWSWGKLFTRIPDEKTSVQWNWEQIRYLRWTWSPCSDRTKPACSPMSSTSSLSSDDRMCCYINPKTEYRD